MEKEEKEGDSQVDHPTGGVEVDIHVGHYPQLRRARPVCFGAR